jgi:hypothetical protein
MFVKCIHLISIMGNQGIFTKNFRQMVTDAELLYHSAYIGFCMLGLCMHPFFYSVLVSTPDELEVQSCPRICWFSICDFSCTRFTTPRKRFEKLRKWTVHKFQNMPSTWLIVLCPRTHAKTSESLSYKWERKCTVNVQCSVQYTLLLPYLMLVMS